MLLVIHVVHLTYCLKSTIKTLLVSGHTIELHSNCNMMTSSNGNIFRVTGPLCGIHRSRWIPHTKASNAVLWCFFDLPLNKRLSKQPWGWWFEMPSWSLWRQCNEWGDAMVIADCKRLMCSKSVDPGATNLTPFYGNNYLQTANFCNWK